MGDVPNFLPDSPKSLGFSRRFLLTLAISGILFIVIFFFLLNHYVFASTKEGAIRETIYDATTSQAVIEQLQQKPVKAAAAPVVQEVVVTIPETSKEASNAPISVFHRESEHSNAPVDHIQPAATSNQIETPWQPAVSPFEMKAGTLIPAILQTEINSDLPGMITGKVRRDVFDTKTGNHLLIPQGTTLIGTYNSQIAYGQERILIAWSRLVFPDASSQDIQGQPGVDVSGQSGLHDKVDHHFLRVFGASTMISSLAAIGQLTQPKTSDPQLTTAQITFGAMGQQWGQTGAQLVEKNLNIQPTIVIRSGTLFNVILQKDLIVPHAYSLD